MNESEFRPDRLVEVEWVLEVSNVYFGSFALRGIAIHRHLPSDRRRLFILMITMITIVGS